MTIREISVAPYDNPAIKNLAHPRRGVEASRTKFEVIYFGSRLLEDVWKMPSSPFLYNGQYYPVAYREIPSANGVWSDTGERQSYVQAEAEAYSGVIGSGLLIEPRNSQSAEERALFQTTNLPAWLEAGTIVQIAKDIPPQKPENQLSPLEIACRNLFILGSHLFVEREIAEQTDAYYTNLATVKRQVRASRFRKIGNLVKDAGRSLVTSVAKSKGAYAADVALFGGIPILTLLNMATSRPKHWAVYHANKAFSSTETYYNERWVSINPDETRKQFMKTYADLQRLIGGSPFVRFDNPTNHGQQLMAPMQFEPKNSKKIDALIASLFLQQDYRQVVGQLTGVVYLREAATLIPQQVKQLLDMRTR